MIDDTMIDAWRDRPMSTLGDLALFLGGSDDSFTGQLLRLFCKADQINWHRLEQAYPSIARALKAWREDFNDRPPTFGELRDWLWEPTDVETTPTQQPQPPPQQPQQR